MPSVEIIVETTFVCKMGVEYAKTEASPVMWDYLHLKQVLPNVGVYSTQGVIK